MKELYEPFTYEQVSHKISENSKNIKLIQKKAIGRIILNNDETRFRQIFTNLLDNAIKFTEKGNIRFGVSEIKTDKLTFFISDTGIGIPKDKHKIIFDRFRQGEETSTRMYGGNGLGLSIVKEFVQLMGGEIWFRSVFGEGTTFYFTLPATNSTDIQEKGPEMQSMDIGKINALIVEDDEYNALYLEELMLGIKAKYSVCREGQTAIDMVKTGNYDIILMDIRLPDINGLDAVKEIRKFNRQITIIAQTAYAMHSDEERAIAAGCNGYVSKPIKKETLLEKINSAPIRKYTKKTSA